MQASLSITGVDIPGCAPLAQALDTVARTGDDAAANLASTTIDHVRAALLVEANPDLWFDRVRHLDPTSVLESGLDMISVMVAERASQAALLTQAADILRRVPAPV
jgi:hypothetical protein